MLDRIDIRGFKSLRDVSVRLPRLTVLFGPNAAGKSNFLDALHFLAGAVTRRSLQEALEEPVRGYPVEAFTFPGEGLAGLLRQSSARFDLDAVLEAPTMNAAGLKLGYKLSVEIEPRSGKLSVANERLERLATSGQPKEGTKPRIEYEDGRVIVRKQKTGQPRHESPGANHTVASIPSYSGEYYPEIEALRQEVSGWRTYYLDPRSAMREPKPPAEVVDIGLSGHQLSAFLYRLYNTSELRRHFDAIVRMVRHVIPSIEALSVELDEQRAQIDLFVEQNGVSFSNRVISEGTLRVIALAAISLNPWPARLIAFEEPENGVHPRRLEHIASLLAFAAGIGRGEMASQVVVNTHSPLFVAEAIKLQAQHPDEVGLIHVSHDGDGSQFRRLGDPRRLFEQYDVDALLKSDEDAEAKVQTLLLQGFLDE